MQLKVNLKFFINIKFDTNFLFKIKIKFKINIIPHQIWNPNEQDLRHKINLFYHHNNIKGDNTINNNKNCLRHNYRLEKIEFSFP